MEHRHESSTRVSSLALARVAEQAATSVAGVVGLHSGVVAEIATYGRDGRVPGVQIRRSSVGEVEVKVRLVVDGARRLPEVAADTRDAIARAIDDIPGATTASVDVHIADIVLGDVAGPTALLDSSS